MNLPEQPAKSSRRRNLLVLALLAGGFLWWNTRQPPLVLSPETTVITSPLLPDGRPDYAAWVNEQAARGVTPDNNAAIAVVRFLGRQELFNDANITFPEQKWAEYLRLLGIPELREDEAFVRWEKVFPSPPGTPITPTPAPFNDVDLFRVEQFPDIALWLAANDTPLNQLCEGIKRERFYSPIVLSPGELLLEARSISGAMQPTTRLLQFRSLSCLQSGDLAGAIDDAISLMRLGRLVTQDVWALSQLVGGSIESRGIKCLGQILMADQLTLTQWQRLREEIQHLPPAGDLESVIDQSERYCMLDLTAALRTSPQAALFNDRDKSMMNFRLRLGQGVNVNQLLELANREHHRMRDIVRISNWRDRQQAMNQLQAEIRGLPVPQANPLVNFINGRLSLDPPHKVVNKRSFRGLMFEFNNPSSLLGFEDSSRVRRMLLDVGMAVTAYRLKHGQYPETLAQLSPEFLETLPLDPWRGEAFRFLPTTKGFTIYSYGPNEFDDDGYERQESARKDDIRFGQEPAAPLVVPTLRR